MKDPIPGQFDELSAIRDRVNLLVGVAEDAVFRAFYAERRASAAEADRDAIQRHLDAVLASKTFRAVAPLRSLYARLRPASAAEAPATPNAANTTPIIVIVRDRLEPLQQLLAWLDRAGHHDVILVDNASTYPPLVEYLASTSHRVLQAGANFGQHSPWLTGIIAEVGQDRPFVVTDPDVVPLDDCPLDAIAHFTTLMERHHVDKVGFGLRIDDLPDHYRHTEAVRRWETPFWRDEVEPGVFRAPIDTTFALYRPGRYHLLDNALRTGPPYLARHLPWYADTERPTAEERYYRDHVDPSVNTWDGAVLPAKYRDPA